MVPTRISRPSTVARNLASDRRESRYRRQAEAALLGGVDDCGPRGCSLSCSASHQREQAGLVQPVEGVRRSAPVSRR